MPVIGRRVSLEILDFLELSALFLTRGGWAVANRNCYPNRSAYRNAIARLNKEGLIIKASVRGETPGLFLSDEGRKLIPDYFYPEKMWNRKWNGIWYMLMYDVPEVDRKYRNVLRRFLVQMRMGGLQKSVWVTPHDIRPDFQDLKLAANIDTFAFLFEARTVLGMPQDRVVETAWDFERLRNLQELYCSMADRNLEELQSTDFDEEELSELLRISMEAYHGAFVEDPLLPWSLCPVGYLGKSVYSLHCLLIKEIGLRLKACQK
jgi:phenylacetic acid degradation operon negative regulatory protein